MRNLTWFGTQMVNDMKEFLLAGVCIPILAAALVLATPAAHAFTFGSQGTADGDSALVDPDEQVKNFGNGATTNQQGGLGFHFGVGPANGSGQTNRSSSPASWVGNPMFLDKGSSQRDQ